MAVNFGTLIEYERMTGENALDASQFANGKIEPILNLAMAMLRSNNAQSDLPNGGRELLDISDPQIISDIITTTVEIYMSFMNGEPGDKEEEAEEGESKNG